LPRATPVAYDRDERSMRAAALLVSLTFAPAIADAGALVGRVDAPELPERPPPQQPGFLDRIENPIAPLHKPDARRYIVIVLEGDEKPAAPAAVPWELSTESFVRPVIAAPAGADITIRNVTKQLHRIVVRDGGKDTKLVDASQMSENDARTFKPTEVGKVYTVVDPDSPHVRGTVVVVNSSFIGYANDDGRYEIGDVPDGSYKVRVYASLPATLVPGGRNGWIELDAANATVTVGKKGKTTLDLKLPANAWSSPEKK
jgi:hypothetical protein